MPNNSAPYEVIGAALTMYVAPLGTAFPDVDTAPSAPWVKLGSSGPLNYDADGIEVDQEQAITLWRALGDAGSRKAFRDSEDLIFRLGLVDLTLEQYSYALNGNTVTTTPAAPGTPGTKKIGLSRGLSIATHAILLRGPSPYMEDGAAQYECPRACQTGKPKPKFARSSPAMLDIEWTALVDPNASSPDEYFGRFVAQTDEAET